MPSSCLHVSVYEAALVLEAKTREIEETFSSPGSEGIVEIENIGVGGEVSRQRG